MKKKPPTRRTPKAAKGFPLEQLLRDVRMSKYRLAKESGIPYPMVCRLAKADANPSWRTVLKILEGLDLAVKFVGYRRPA